MSARPDARLLLVSVLVSLTLAWVNYLTTARWAGIPGALHGWRSPWYAAALVVATVVVAWWAFHPDAPAGASRTRLPLVVFFAGTAVLAAAFLSGFPPRVWGELPFLDDWPGLLQIAVNGVDLLKSGAVVGWNWDFLGGYHTSADLGQSLAATAFVPFMIAGPKVGLHLLIALYTLLIPAAVYSDIRLEGSRRSAWLAAGVAGLLAAGYFGTIMRTGMANSVAGVGFAGFALVGSHAARLGRRWGGALLVLSLTLVLYSHAAFFLYAAVCLGVEAVFYRSLRGTWRSAAALGLAFVAALPLHWELLTLPTYFHPNNLYWDAPPAFDWQGLVRGVFYAIQILCLPWRWFNDYVGVTHVWLPAVVAVALLNKTRSGYYAWATLAVLALLRLNTPQLGIVLSRELFMYPLVLAPVLGALIEAVPRRPPVAHAVVAVLFLFVAVPFMPVPHVPSVDAFNAPLVERIRQAPGQMALIENNPHWNMIATPGQRSLPSRFGVHYEALLPAATGKRFFGQPQDGYHRSTFRGNVLAGGAYRGRAIGDTDPEAFAAELRRWGVASLFIWSEASSRYLDSSQAFVLRWQADPWREYRLVDADVREVVTSSGAGSITRRDGLGASVTLVDVRAGDQVTVRTNYFPAWRADARGRDIQLFSNGGQLAFVAPAGGSYTVQLTYPKRQALSLLAGLIACVGAAALSVVWLGSGRGDSDRPTLRVEPKP